MVCLDIFFLSATKTKRINKKCNTRITSPTPIIKIDLMHIVDDSDVSHAVNSKIVHTNSHTYYLELYQKNRRIRPKI
jgi:hypothetical protein